mmetsp:Transcript_44747/g.50171  ORF Transcript_44747/g.50171 Transcript_44747/m.50171 type:complete len:282 (+) Transcript_44747:115-960(+)|eukprot:CAMPEP_0170873804 /NCGR_PEP_ID=MMETSP0734-20130129/27663_1 /TAXON_ID=186038 /ORGANISM="Fragilariopsis kerguelensis, Strain L26-C5" /LENGTH=281 /DNA_ID=CAMNT_0011254417 /DNA_START=90 /DNA_END=935 /DNA_ORIENTATION=+
MLFLNIVVLFQQVAGLLALQDHKSYRYTIRPTQILFRDRTSTAFVCRRSFITKRHCDTSTSTRIRSKPEELEFYDDGIGDISNRNNGNSDDDSLQQDSHSDLASEFFKELNRRENEFDYLVEPPSLSREKEEQKEVSAEAARKESSFSEENIIISKQTSQKKFTGRTNNDFDRSNQYSNYFGSSSTPSSNNNNNSVRGEMMRNEFNLVSRVTGPTGLAIQAGIALFMLLFYIYIGMTGGIGSGDEAANAIDAIGDFGGDNNSIQFEQIIPVQRDTENSVFL